jgi:hypothetical protein
MILESDRDLEDLADMIESVLKYGFQVSEKYIHAFNDIRLFCLENLRLDLNIFRDETGKC